MTYYKKPDLFANPCAKSGRCSSGDATCPHAVVRGAQPGGFFITFGHAGYNTPKNNAFGYSTEATARAAIKRLVSPRAARPTLRPVVADVRDRHDIDRIITKGRRFEPGTIKTVTFKDEGDDAGMRFGPVTLYRDEQAPHAFGGVPYGTPDPDGVYYLGWLSARMAQNIARYLAAHFEEV